MLVLGEVNDYAFDIIMKSLSLTRNYRDDVIFILTDFNLQALPKDFDMDLYGEHILSMKGTDQRGLRPVNGFHSQRLFCVVFVAKNLADEW